MEQEVIFVTYALTICLKFGFRPSECQNLSCRFFAVYDECNSPLYNQSPWPYHCILTYSTERSPSWEANRFSASQDIPHILCNSKVHCRSHKHPFGRILRHIQPVHPFTTHFLKIHLSVDKKNQLDVTFCILYFSSNSCSTCFEQPCAHHQKLTTAWCYSLVLVCAVVAGRLSSPVGR